MEVRLSAVIITFNEESNIQRCLESIEGVVDEIVVVDSYSTDRTEEICRSFKVKFIRHRFFGHIEQKNWAILQAASPYILSIDADEVLSMELRKSILRVKKDWIRDGYSFNRLNSYCGKWIRHTSWYPDRKLRLWDARKGQWGGINPHDKFILSEGSKQERLRGDLLHYSYNSVSEHVARINSFSTIMSQSLYSMGRRSSIHKIVLHPLWRFIKDFLVKGGFRDGYYGFIISINSSYAVFLKYVKLRNLHFQMKRANQQTICLFNSEKSWGGGEKWHMDVASHLLDRGFRVFYIASPESPLAKRMVKSGVPGYQIRFSNLSFLNPLKLWKLVILFRREKVGSLVSSLPSDMKVAGIAAKIAGVGRIIYRRGSAIPIRNTFLNRFLFRRVLSRIIANSLEVKRTILANNSRLVPEEKISIIYNGVNLARYNTDSPPLYRVSGKEIMLGSAGRLSEEKGHLHLVDLMSVLEESKYHFKLLVAGKGKMLDVLKKKVRELGMEERIEFLGFIADMPAFFNSIDIFLLPSRYEGFSNVVIEAMASSKPVISFNVGSTREIIDHRITGFIGKVNSVEEMAHYILELAADDSMRKMMGQKARERIENDFTFERGLEELILLLTGDQRSI